MATGETGIGASMVGGIAAGAAAGAIEYFAPANKANLRAINARFTQEQAVLPEVAVPELPKVPVRTLISITPAEGSTKSSNITVEVPAGEKAPKIRIYPNNHGVPNASSPKVTIVFEKMEVPPED